MTTEEIAGTLNTCWLLPPASNTDDGKSRFTGDRVRHVPTAD